jgi:hypothetical protein
MSSDTDEHALLWQEISKLKEAHSDMRVEAAMAAKALDSMTLALNELRDEVKALRNEVAERRGATRIAMWLLGTLIALGVPAAWIAQVGGNR